MTEKGDLPSEATEEPRVHTPKEEGERAFRRLEQTIADEKNGQHRDTSRADDPLRMPGELESPPPGTPPERR